MRQRRHRLSSFAAIEERAHRLHEIERAPRRASQAGQISSARGEGELVEAGIEIGAKISHPAARPPEASLGRRSQALPKKERALSGPLGLAEVREVRPLREEVNLSQLGLELSQGERPVGSKMAPEQDAEALPQEAPSQETGRVLCGYRVAEIGLQRVEVPYQKRRDPISKAPISKSRPSRRALLYALLGHAKPRSFGGLGDRVQGFFQCFELFGHSGDELRAGESWSDAKPYRAEDDERGERERFRREGTLHEESLEAKPRGKEAGEGFSGATVEAG